MKSFIVAMEKLPLLVKVLLALPFLDIVWVVYRIIRSVDKQNWVGVLIAVIFIIIGIPFLWLIDMLCILIIGHVWWID
ncbi:MAG: hypothetical protein HFI85_01030 [Clostridia bacterium]|jgi:hypothetical protein|nr:hypothetical protein [Clostridia bacterium]